MINEYSNNFIKWSDFEFSANFLPSSFMVIITTFAIYYNRSMKQFSSILWRTIHLRLEVQLSWSCNNILLSLVELLVYCKLFYSDWKIYINDYLIWSSFCKKIFLIRRTEKNNSGKTCQCSTSSLSVLPKREKNLA